jgi:transcription initiation factor IIF auxiliary subunit
MNIRSKLLKEGKKIPYRVFRNGGKEHYHVRIYVEGGAKEIFEIEKVVYHLHKSFRNARRVSYDSDAGFPLEIWSWGLFPIEAEIHFKNGKVEKMTGNVEFELPADTGNNYVQG